ncbi:MAG: hypothetical protein MRY74_15070, partial [Neomegalonema sp.]|nr:hypothetical protein [Neomegalonema sp.]
SSNSTPGARLRDRPKGRPRGACERSELGASEMMAGSEGESSNPVFEILEDWERQLQPLDWSRFEKTGDKFEEAQR